MRAKPIALTVLSYGGGQESTMLVHRLLHDEEFYKDHIKGDLLIVGSDTGDEHPHTHTAIDYIRDLCAFKGINFYWVTPDMGFHSEAWSSLTGQYKRTSTIGSAAFQQTCTDNLKVKVVDRFVESWIKSWYGVTGERKGAYHDFYERFGRIRLILGFAKGEESRTKNGNRFDAVWKKKVVQRYFPLIIDGLGRQECINYNQEHLMFIVWPSNCMRCFYSSDQEILWLWRNYPDKFAEWVMIEKAKLEKWKHLDLQDPPKNYGVYGRIYLEQKLEKAQKLYGHWSDEQLDEYKYSHGHCIKSKY